MSVFSETNTQPPFVSLNQTIRSVCFTDRDAVLYSPWVRALVILFFSMEALNFDCLRRLFYFVAPTLLSVPGEGLLPVSASDRSWISPESSIPADDAHFLKHLRGHAQRVLYLTSVCRDWAALVNWVEVGANLWKNMARRRTGNGKPRQHPFARPRAILRNPCVAAFDGRTLVAAAMASHYLTTRPVDFHWPPGALRAEAGEYTWRSLTSTPQPGPAPAVCIAKGQRNAGLNIPDPDPKIIWPWVLVHEGRDENRSHWRTVFSTMPADTALDSLANDVYGSISMITTARPLADDDDDDDGRSVVSLIDTLLQEWRHARTELARFEDALGSAIVEEKMRTRSAASIKQAAKRREKAREKKVLEYEAEKKRRRQQEEEEEGSARKRPRLE